MHRGSAFQARGQSKPTRVDTDTRHPDNRRSGSPQPVVPYHSIDLASLPRRPEDRASRARSGWYRALALPACGSGVSGGNLKVIAHTIGLVRIDDAGQALGKLSEIGRSGGSVLYELRCRIEAAGQEG